MTVMVVDGGWLTRSGLWWVHLDQLLGLRLHWSVQSPTEEGLCMLHNSSEVFLALGTVFNICDMLPFSPCFSWRVFSLTEGGHSLCLSSEGNLSCGYLL